MAQFIATQSKTNETLTASINQLTSKFDTMAAHQKAMDTQIAQIAQQVSSLSRPQGQLPGQPEINPRGHVNAVYTRDEEVVESPVMVLQETVLVPNSAGTIAQEVEGCSSLMGKANPTPPTRSYHPPVPYPQRVAWAQLFQHEPKFARFLDALKRIYADTPFLEALKKAPTHIQFLRELVSKKGEPVKGPIVPIGEACSALLQRPPLPKLQDPGSFSIPCCIGDVQIERALCDLGASVSLMPLSLCKKLELLHLKPTATVIQLADRTLRRPAGVLEDVPIQVGKFIIPCDFIVIDMDEGSQVPIIFGRPFLATAGAVIDVQAGTISFQFCDERVDFCFPPPSPPPASVPLSPPETHAHCASNGTTPDVTAFDEDAGPRRRSVELPNTRTPTYATPGGKLRIHHPGENGILQGHHYDALEPPPPIRATREGTTVHRKETLVNVLSLDDLFSWPPPLPS